MPQPPVAKPAQPPELREAAPEIDALPAGPFHASARFCTRWEAEQNRDVPAQEKRCADDVPGDTHRHLSVDNTYSAVTFKHVLLPVWIAAYRYREKVYRFLFNGQTGEVVGKAPWSLYKIALFVLALAAVAIALYYFFGRHQ